MAGPVFYDSPFGKVYARGEVAFLRSKAGGLVTVPVGEAANTLAGGEYVPASPDEVAARDMEKARGSLTEQAKAAAEAFAAGAYDVATSPVTLPVKLGAALAGVEDPTAKISGRKTLENVAAVGAEVTGGEGEVAAAQYAEAARERAQANPVTHLVGNLAGQVAGGVGISGGVKALGTSLAEGGLGRLAGKGLAGAIEGAGYGAVAATEESYIENRQLTAEQLLGSMGVGAFVGGAVTLGGEGAGMVFRRIKSRGETPVEATKLSRPGSPYRTSDEALAETAANILPDKPAPGFGEKLRDAIESAQTATTGAEKETLEKYGAFRWDKTAQRGRDLWRNREQILEGATDDITKQADTLIKRSKAVTREVWEVPAKTEQVTRNLSAVGKEETERMITASREAADQLRNDIRGTIEQVGGKGPNAKYLRDLEDWATIEGAIAGDDPAATYIALDRAKRAIQKKVDSMGASLHLETNPLLRDQKAAMVQSLESAQSRVRSFLMDEGVWGAQGTAQREANAAAERYLKVNRMFEQTFATKMGREYGAVGGRPLYDANPASISSYVRGLGKREGALKDKVFREYVDSTLNLAESISKGYRLDGDAATALAELQGAARAIKETLTVADSTVRVANQIDEVIAAESGSGLSLLGGLGLGGLGGGPIGAAAGAAYGAVTRPGQLIRQAAAIQQLTKHFDGKLDTALERFFNRVGAATKRAARGAEHEEGKVAFVAEQARHHAKFETGLHQTKHALEGEHGEGHGAKARHVAIPTALAAFQGRHDSLPKAYEARVNEVLSATKDYGAAIRDRVQSGGLGDLPTVTPRLSQELVVAATKAAEYLKSKIPAGVVSPTVMQPSRKIPVAQADIHRFARIWATVNNPLSALEDLRRGQFMPAQAEALKAVYPQLFDRIRMTTLQKIRELDSSGRPIAYRDRLQLDILLDLGGTGEPTMTMGFATRLDQLRAAKANEQPTPSPPPASNSTAGDRLKSGLQRIGT